MDGTGSRRLKLATLPGGGYVKARQIILVSDNLNTHTKGAFYDLLRPKPGPRLRARHPRLPHTKRR